MKNIIKCLISLLIITSIACKDKPKPKPEPAATANINDLVGKWASVDSSICNVNNKYFYIHDSILISKDTIYLGRKYSILVIFHRCTASARYSAKYFGQDSLILKYSGPTLILTPDGRHKVIFNKSKDTISILDFRTTYPGCNFNKFYKKK